MANKWEQDSGYISRPEIERNLIHLLKLKSPVYLFGPGGVGKTRLARYVAGTGEIHESFQQVFLLEALSLEGIDMLKPVRDLDGLTFTQVLADGRSLFVVDNFDLLEIDVQKKAASFIHSLSRSGAAVVVVTRYPTHEQTVLQVPSMSLDQGRELLMNRIERTVPQSTVTERDIDAIVEAVNGVPLAIELVAAQFRYRTAVEIIQGIRHSQSEQERDTVNKGSGEYLRKIISWALESLTPVELNLLEAIALNADDTPIRYLEALSGLDPPDLLVVGGELSSKALVDQSRVSFAMRASVRSAVVEQMRSGTKGSLFITFDPAAITNQYVVELLEGLNWLYSELGGEELIITEDEIGRFLKRGALV